MQSSLAGKWVVAGRLRFTARQQLGALPLCLCCMQVGCLVSYGLTYSFPAGDEEQQPLAPLYAAAPGQPLPRPAPLTPGIDTLHCYSCLGSSTCNSTPAAAVGPGCPKGMLPLVVRQQLSQMISAANINRIEQVSSHGQPCMRGRTAQQQQERLLLSQPAQCNYYSAF